MDSAGRKRKRAVTVLLYVHQCHWRCLINSFFAMLCCQKKKKFPSHTYNTAVHSHLRVYLYAKAGRMV